MDYVLSDTLMFIALMGLAGWILFLLYRRSHLMMQARMQRIEAYNKLIEKFSSSKEFVEFLQTEQGKQLLEDPIPGSANPKKVALRFVQAGGLLGAIGFGLLLSLSRLTNIVHTQTNPDINWVNKELDFFTWTWVILAMSAGCFFVASLTYSLGKKWKLFSNGTSSH